MADSFISFQPSNIRALLEDRKTKSRRIFNIPDGFHGPVHRLAPEINFFSGDRRLHFLVRKSPGEHQWIPMRHAAGDRLWVKEAWLVDRQYDASLPSELPDDLRPVWYDAGYLVGTGSQRFFVKQSGADYDASHVRGRLRAARFMPKRFSRITLIVTDVRPQRLHDISPEDAIAEGLIQIRPNRWWYTLEHKNAPGSPNPVTAYSCLWDEIHGPGAWDANPWVAAYTFKIMKENIERIAA